MGQESDWQTRLTNTIRDYIDMIQKWFIGSDFIELIALLH